MVGATTSIMSLVPIMSTGKTPLTLLVIMHCPRYQSSGHPRQQHLLPHFHSLPMSGVLLQACDGILPTAWEFDPAVSQLC